MAGDLMGLCLDLGWQLLTGGPNTGSEILWEGLTRLGDILGLLGVGIVGAKPFMFV